MATTAEATRQPNLFELHRKSLHVMYSTSGIDGRPRLHYTDKRTDKTFTGDEIRVTDVGIGRLVTVTLELVPDLHERTFSVLIPDMNIDREAHIETEAIYTVARTSIGGPTLVKGQIQTYRAITVSGTARAVEF